MSSSQPAGGQDNEVVDWSDLAARMWSFLTGRDAAVHYKFDDIAVEIPRDTGANAPRATWKIDGTVTITTSDNAEPVAPGTTSGAGSSSAPGSVEGTGS